jgi:hypothetical protein
MPGILEFTLGLETKSFLDKLGFSEGKVLGFASVAELLHKGFEKVEQAFERGIGLEHLSKRTGESVQTLYQLQKAFQSAGVSADEVGPVLFRMERSIGGINELGEHTADIFARMGISLASLKTKDAGAQMQTILGSIAKLNQSQAASASSSIFGREGGATMLQIARSSKEVRDAMQAAAATGALFQRHAAAFQKMHHLILEIKNYMEDLAAKAAVFFTGLAGAFKEGKLSELLGDTLKLGLDSFIAYAPGAFEKLGVIILKIFQTPLLYMQAALDVLIDDAVHSPVSKFLGVSGSSGKGMSFDEALAGAKQTGLQFGSGSDPFGIADISKDADTRLAAAKAAMAGNWSDYWKTVEGFADKIKKSGAQIKTKGGGGLSENTHFKPEFTSLEKMGFVMSGLGNPLLDPARSTAAGVARLVEIAEASGGRWNPTSFSDSGIRQP